ncbi:MAG: T9SS type A sorting domain-containing protein [Bacteroidia bacterium]|nr:T9SS type A sorting domain-containing protein [Bacteroidia bacterium]
MKKLLLILSNIVFFANAQQNTFSKIIVDTVSFYGAPNIQAVVATNDNGVIVTGGLSFNGTFTGAATVLKIDSSGNVIWGKAFSRNNYYSYITCIAPTNDSGFILAGNNFTNTNDINLLVAKINSNGDTLWSKSLHPNTCRHISPRSILQTNDSGFVFTGVAIGDSSQGVGIIVCKLDLNGNPQWTRFITTDPVIGASARGNAIQQTADGGYIISGIICSGIYNGNQYEACIIKLLPDGSLSWAKKYKTTSSENCEGTGLLLENSGFVALVCIDDKRAALMKTDLSGNVLWAKIVAKSFNRNTSLTAKCHKNADGSYLISSASCFGSSMTKTDSMANIAWSKTFSLTGLDALELSDNGFFIIGRSPVCENNEFIHPKGGLGIIKTDSLGNQATCVSSVSEVAVSESMVASPANLNSFTKVVSNSVVPDVNNFNNLASSPGCLDFSGAIHPNDFGNDVVVSPNPSSGVFTLTTFSFDNAKYMVYNSMGELIWDSRYFTLRTEIDLTGFPKGIYFYKLFYQATGKVVSGKLITTD